MSAVAAPALRLDRVVIRASAPTAVTAQAPRDLPNLARFLIDVVAQDTERAYKLVDDLTIDVAPAERVALLGEEGCGKTTIARACARLLPVDAGSIAVAGVDTKSRRREQQRHVRRMLSVIFDDPEHGFDPRRTIERALIDAAAALALVDAERDVATLVRTAAVRARFPVDALATRAGVLAPGLRARAALARALLAEPAVVVIDEPAARLDPLERALLLEALGGLARVSGDPAPAPAVLALTQRPDVARALAQRVGVLYLGTLVELGGPDVLDDPRHPYTRALLEAAPRRARPATARAIAGDLPSIGERPAGCPFHPRCPDAIARCASERPVLLGDRRAVACHVVGQE